MTRVFISYAEEDGEVAQRIAHGLESEGYSTWYYQRDSVGGESHLELTANAIREAKAFIVLLSRKSCASEEVKSEFFGARERRKLIMPLRCGITHDELMSKFASWHVALGGRVEIDVSSDVGSAIEQIVKSLRTHKISPDKPPSGKALRPEPKLPPPPPPRRAPPVKASPVKALPVKASPVKTPPSKEAVEASSRRERSVKMGCAVNIVWLGPAAVVVVLAALVAPWWALQSHPGQEDSTDHGIPPVPSKLEPPPPPEPPKDVFAILAECERQAEEYVKQDPKEAANAAAKSVADAAQAWAKEERPKLDREKEALEKQLATVHELENRLKQMELRIKEEPDATDAGAVNAHNRLVQEYNGLADQRRTAGDAYKTAEAAFNRQAETFNREFERRQAAIKAAEEIASKRLEQYNDWRKKGGTATLWRQLCRCFADLKTMDASKPDDPPRVRDALRRARDLRAELAAHLKAQQDASESGFLIVEVEISEGEPCYLVADISSSVCSLSAEMVDALDLGKFQGSELKLELAGGLVIDVPQLVIPRIAVGEEEALFVKAVVLEESRPGTDGRLGLSFLHRFDYTIEGGAPRTLILRPSGPPDTTQAYDVFICHHANDLNLAQEVYQVLEGAGFRAFLSQVSLGRLRAAEFQKAIDDALAGATHMVVVCSAADHVKTPWVEAEWRLFDRLKTSGEKQGNIVAVVSGSQASDLPAPLNSYEVVPMGDLDWTQTLVDYFKP